MSLPPEPTAAPNGGGWPLPWAGATSPAAAADGRRPGFPPGHWPSLGQLTYTKEAITVLLLVLALPWLVSKLLTRPGDVLQGLGRRAAGRVSGG